MSVGTIAQKFTVATAGLFALLVGGGFLFSLLPDSLEGYSWLVLPVGIVGAHLIWGRD